MLSHMKKSLPLVKNGLLVMTEFQVNEVLCAFQKISKNTW